MFKTAREHFQVALDEIREAVQADAAESISNEDYRNDYIVGFLIAVIASKNRMAKGE